MGRLITIIIFCIFLVAISGCNPGEQKGNIRRPNVLFILVDDLGAYDLGYTGSNFYETPNVDNLAKTSFVFTNGYAASRVCSPSRASIMTGKFTARHGITDWIGAASGEKWRKLNRHDRLLPASYVQHLPFKDITLPEHLQKNDYKTFFAGKWHLGNEGSYPEDHGFDINVGGWEKGSPMGGFFSPWNNPKLKNRVEGENLSMRLAKETVNFFQEYRDSTFFAFLSFYAVHAPIETTQEKWEKYQKKAIEQDISESGFKMERVLPIRQVQDNPIYAGLVESMDDAIGLVLQSLQDLGLADNTIVIFTSDNGGVASGDAFSTSNLPLRGGKGYQWEGGIREPFLIQVPWMNGNGKLIDYSAIGTDFYPTILDIIGLELLPDQHVDGLSLKPLLEGKTLPQRPLYWHYPHYGNQGGEPSSIIREGNWKLIHYWEDGRDELYDLSADPMELNDMSEEIPDVKAKLFKKLNQWLIQNNAKFPELDEEYDRKLAKNRKEEIRTKLWASLEQRRLEILSEDFSPNKEWWGSQIQSE